jgi:brefeldin A-inhibited guanine nucleotide-exchange protein
VCFRELFFKVLQSRSATFEQKLLLVETLHRIAAKPQVVMDIYLNFDCDPDLLDSNVFERCGDARVPSWPVPLLWRD